MKGTRSHRLVSNAIFTVVPQLWFLVLAVFSTPYILRNLGADAYGILSLVTVLSGYLAFLDLGLNLAIIKFISAHHAKGEFDEITRVTQTAAFVFLSMTILSGSIIAFLSESLVGLVNIPEGLRSDAVVAFRLGALGFGINLVMGVYSAIPRSLQRFDLLSKVSFFVGTSQIIVTVLLLATGLGLRSIVAWGCLLSAFSLVIYVVLAKKLLPGVRLRPRFDAGKFRELFAFSGYVMASNGVSVAAAHSEKLILGGLAPISQVTYYSIPFNLVSRVTTLIPSNMNAVLFPALASMSATEPLVSIQKVYLRAFRLIFVCVTPVSILLVAFGDELLRLWIGDEMAINGGPVLAILSVAILINAPAWVSVSVGQSMGRPGIMVASSLAHLAVLIVSGIVLIPRYGAMGAALAWLMGNCLGVPVLVVLVNRYALGLNSLQMLREAVLGPTISLLIMLACALAVRRYVVGVPLLLVSSSFLTIGYAALAYLAVIDSQDRALLKTLIPNRIA
jgi:O-antigen/teichoic acid export membrane protein